MKFYSCTVDDYADCAMVQSTNWVLNSWTYLLRFKVGLQVGLQSSSCSILLFSLSYACFSGSSCEVCDGDFRPDILVPFENLDGATCEDVVLETSIDCFSRQYAEALCCPSAASTCSICKGTKLLADVEVVDSNGATWTCVETAYNAASFEATSEDCTMWLAYEEYCCPDVFIPTTSSTSPPIDFSTPQSTYSFSR